MSLRSASPRQIRYLFVGAFNTASGFFVSAALYYLLDRVIGIYAVLGLCTVLNITTSYITTKLVVFRTPGWSFAEYLRFYAVAAVPIACNFLILPILIDVLGWNAYVSMAIVTILNVILGYLGHSRLTFRTPRRRHETRS